MRRSFLAICRETECDQAYDIKWKWLRIQWAGTSRTVKWRHNVIDYDVKCQQRPGRFSIDQFHKEPQTHVQRSSFSYIYIHFLLIPIRSETFQGWFLNKTESFLLRRLEFIWPSTREPRTKPEGQTFSR